MNLVDLEESNVEEKNIIHESDTYLIRHKIKISKNKSIKTKQYDYQSPKLSQYIDPASFQYWLPT
jgi:hypothetical protein